MSKECSDVHQGPENKKNSQNWTRNERDSEHVVKDDVEGEREMRGNHQKA
jgi:hypothetical protein